MHQQLSLSLFFLDTVSGRRTVHQWPVCVWALMANCCFQLGRSSRCGTWKPRRFTGWASCLKIYIHVCFSRPVSSIVAFHANTLKPHYPVEKKRRIDLTALLFVVPAEVHRALHGRDDPVLCHHETSRQQRPLFPVRRCTRSTAQCLVSARVTVRAHAWLLARLCSWHHLKLELTRRRLPVGKYERTERTRIQWCPSRWRTSRNTSTSSRPTARKRSEERSVSVYAGTIMIYFGLNCS